MKDVAFIKMENSGLFLESRQSTPKNFVNTLQNFLEKATKKSWVIHIEQSNNCLTLIEKRDLKRQNDKIAIQKHELVQDILKNFPGATLIFENE
jgi:hypothetical protein